MIKASQVFTTLIFGVCALGLSSTAMADPFNGAPIGKKSAKAKPEKVEATSTTAEPEAETEMKHDSSVDYKCELGNSLTMYSHSDDNQTIALRWKNKLHRLTRVETTTGANRFENQKIGLVWIDIPAKGMLLDSLRGKQLANECKSTQ